MIHLLINGTDKIRQHRLKPITADETSEQEPDIFLRMLIIIGNFLRLIVFSNCFKRKAPHRDKMIDLSARRPWQTVHNAKRNRVFFKN